MSSKAAKFAPFCVVASTLGYLCWPYFEDPTPPSTKAKAAPTLVELTPAVLSPASAPPVTRDLFGSEATAQKLAASKANQKTGPVDKAKTAASKNAEPEPPPPAEKPKIKPPSSLVLNGTYVRGDHRVAVINQAVYAEGDRVKLADHAGVRCNLNRVDIDRVVLELEEGIAELEYPGLDPPKPAPNSASPAPANSPKPEPAAKRKPQTTTK
jgi:hypothetical protein